MNGFFGMMLIGLAPWLLFGGGIFYLGLRYVRGTERRAAIQGEFGDSQRRITELEDAVGQLTSEMARLSDGQQFTAQLIAGKESPNPVSPPLGGQSRYK